MGLGVRVCVYIISLFVVKVLAAEAATTRNTTMLSIELENQKKKKENKVEESRIDRQSESGDCRCWLYLEQLGVCLRLFGLISNQDKQPLHVDRFMFEIRDPPR